MSLKILALTRYDQTGASSRVRFLQYIPHLERMGARIAVKPLFPRAYLTRLYEGQSRAPFMVISAMFRRFWKSIRESDADIIWLQREMLPFAPFALENLLLGTRKLVLDLDDAHHLYYKNHPSWLGRVSYKTKVDALIKRASAVVVGNPTLAEYAQAVGASNVHGVPSAVDVSRFKSGGNKTSDVFQVGWIGTPVTANQSLPLIREPLLRFLSNFNANQFPEIPATRVAWSEAAEEKYLPRLSVGLCPLDNTPWNRGKSGYKIIQYMASGKPSLVSPVGIAERMISHGNTGFHCLDSDDWYSHLVALYKNTDLRASMGRQAAVEAEAKYDTASAAAALHRIFQECANG
jgi:glycosyltransferase involved in cell wall biosynthesis